MQFIRQNLIDLQAKNPINFNPLALAKWIRYCDKEEINFSKKNLQYWIKKMEKPTSIEQLEAVEYAIEQKWKNFYTKDSKTSPYQQYLGKSIMTDKFCDTLYDVLKEKEKFVYKFKNITLKIEMPIDQLFKEYEYTPNKTIIPKIKSLLGFTKKM